MYRNPSAKTTPVSYANISAELQKLVQWVTWGMENGRKVPRDAKTGTRASSTNQNTWSSFNAVAGAARIGFMFDEDDPYTFIDLDHCRDPKTGAIAEWAQDWISKFPGAYVEISQSGTGIHIIMRGRILDKYLGDKGGRKNQKAGVEAYSFWRFCAITGDVIGEVPEKIARHQAALDDLCETYFAVEERPKNPTPIEPIDYADEELWQKARRAGNGMGELFTKLHDRGDFSDFPSHSDARLAYLKNAAYWTGKDIERMCRWYESSALIDVGESHEGKPVDYRRKWARLWQRECNLAIARTGKVYAPVREKLVVSPKNPKEAKDDGHHLDEVIEALRYQAANDPWEGRTGPTDRHVYEALISWAEKYGSISKRGIVVAADVRNLALEAGTSIQTVRNSLERLADKELRNLIRVKKGTGRVPSKYLIRYPKQKAPGLVHKTCGVYVLAYAQLRNQGPKRRKVRAQDSRRRVSTEVDGRYLLERIGKYAALILQHVHQHCDVSTGMSVKEIACGLNRKPYQLRRSKAFQTLVSDGFLVEVSEGMYATPADLEWRLDMELELSGCKEARTRDAERYAREREAFRARRKARAAEVPSGEELDARRRQRVLVALDAICVEGSPAQRAAHARYDGETSLKSVVYEVVDAVLGDPIKGTVPADEYTEEYARWRDDVCGLWLGPVRDACSLYFGEDADVTNSGRLQTEEAPAGDAPVHNEVQERKLSRVRRRLGNPDIPPGRAYARYLKTRDFGDLQAVVQAVADYEGDPYGRWKDVVFHAVSEEGEG